MPPCDPAWPGLTAAQVPALREHVHGIASRGRIHSARRLASGLCGFALSSALLLRDQGQLGAEASGGVKQAYEAQAEALRAALAARCDEWGDALRKIVLEEGQSVCRPCSPARSGQFL